MSRSYCARHCRLVSCFDRFDSAVADLAISNGLPGDIVNIIAGFLEGKQNEDQIEFPGGKRTTKDLMVLSNRVLNVWEMEHIDKNLKMMGRRHRN